MSDTVVGIIVTSDASPQNAAVTVAVEELERAAAAGGERGASAERTSLLEQLVIYFARANGTEQSMGSALLLRRLAFTIDEKISAVVPHLDTADASQRRVLHDVLSTVDRVDGADADFSPYVRLLRAPGVTADRLTFYMYEIDPHKAVRTLHNVHGTAQTRTFPALQDAISGVSWLTAERDHGREWTDREHEAYRRHLDNLGASPHWWIRLYAAALAVRYPQASVPDLLARLRDDPDHRVRAMASGRTLSR